MTDYRALVAALRCDGAYRYDCCKGCLYEWRCLVSNQMQDAADAIEELMAEIEHIRQTSVSHEVYQTVCRERDAAVADCRHNDACAVCIGSKTPAACDCECLDCTLDCRCLDCHEGERWEWRGKEYYKAMKPRSVISLQAMASTEVQSAKDTNILGKWISVEDRPLDPPKEDNP